MKRADDSNKIYFWERIAFRISVGFVLPVLISAYALYSVSSTFSEVSETKEKMQRMWSGIAMQESKAILTLTKMRMHAQAFQYESNVDLARQLEGEAKAFQLDMANSRRSLETLSLESGTALETPIKKAYDDIHKKQEELSAAVTRMVDSNRRGSPTDTAAARQELERAAQGAESMIARLHAQNDRFEGTLSARIADAEERSRSTLTFYLLAVFILGIAAAWLVTYSIISPVKRLLVRIRDIATGDGDLTKRVVVRGGGEMTELAHWVNVFLDKTHGIIATIANASSTVHGTTAEVGRIAEGMSVSAAAINHSMMEQSMNIDECTGRVGSIDDLIQNAGESTRQAASLSKIAMDRALQGGASVHEMVEAMEKIEESARKVEELVSSINEIASQTNLLAINAAIEATKAGEHGKGFAVVAEEVRKLAERARKLTAEVTGLIGESSGRVKAGVGLARNAGISLDGIIKDVEAVVSLIQRIASASAKQTESSNVALEFMQKVSEAVRNNLRDMEGVTKATESTSNEVLRLNALVSQLNEVVGQFQLDENFAVPEESSAAVVPIPVDPTEETTREIQAPGPVSAAEDLSVDSSVPGELSFERMMNPGVRAPDDLPPPPPGLPRAPLAGLPPLPPGAKPVEEGEEDAA